MCTTNIYIDICILNIYIFVAIAYILGTPSDTFYYSIGHPTPILAKT